MQLSIVIPVHNEQENIAPLAAELEAVRPKCPEMEAVFADDGSTDRTWDEIQAACRAHPFIRGVRTHDHHGQSSALLMGLRSSRGDILVTMDGDLQNDPADIPTLLGQLAAVDVVCGYRAKRKDTWSRRAGSHVANVVRNWVTNDGVRDTGCSLKAFRRKCLDDLPPLNGVHRFMPAYFKLFSRTIAEVPVNHRPRQFGISKYSNLKRLPKTVFDLIGFVWYRTRLLLHVTDQMEGTDLR